MSSGIVRQSFRGALQAAFPAVQYIETIGARVDNNALADLWQTIEFVPETDQPIALGTPTCWREVGVVRVWAGASAGQGDTSLVAHLDAVLAAFRRYTDPAAGIRVIAVSPPQTSPESDGRWLLCSVDLRYQRDYTA